MKTLGAKDLFKRLGGAKAVEKVADQVGGKRAGEELLAQAGYPGKPAGLAARLGVELNRSLPLKVDAPNRRAFGEVFAGPRILNHAKGEAQLQHPQPFPGQDRPAAQVRLTPEEEASLWPWLSGQRALRLARAHLISGEPALGRAAAQAMADCCRHHPALMGPGWRRLELPALRAVNWLLAFRLVGDPAALDPEVVLAALVHLRVGGTILAQALAEQEGGPRPEEVAPAAALIFLGRCLGFLPEAPAWLELGCRLVGPALSAWDRPADSRPSGQVAWAAQWGGLALWLAVQHNLELPRAVSGLRSQAALCRAAAPPWGAGLAWGWSPLERVLDWGPVGPDAYTCAANLAAVLLDAPELRAGRIMDEGLFWLKGKAAAEDLRELAGGGPPAPLDAPAAGVTTFFAKAGGRGVSVWLRTAPRRREPAPWAAQALALGVSLDCQPLFAPPGPPGSGPLASHLAQRSAFSLPMVDTSQPGAGQVELEHLEKGKRHLFMSASFDGYAHLEDPVILRRRVFLDLAGGMLQVVDQVQARGEHFCEVFFHLPPRTDCSQRPDGTWGLAGDFGQAALRPDPGAACEVVSGRSHPPLGWRAVGLGRVEAAPVLQMTATMTGSARLTTILTWGPANNLVFS